MTYRLAQGKTVVGIGQPQVALGIDGWIRFRVNTPLRKGAAYTLTVDANDVSGNTLRRTLSVRGT